MMANNALALNVATPQIDPVGAFEAGQQAGQQQAMAKLQQAEAGLKHLGQLAFGVMGGKLDGPVDPAMWDQAVATLGPEGEKYKGRPDLAPILAKASVDVLGQLQIVQNERELDMRLQEFQRKIDEAAQPIEINNQLVDPNTLEVVGDYRTESADSPSLPTSYREFELAQQNPEYAASLNSSTSRPPTEGQRRNQQLTAVIEPELKIIEDNWDALTDPGNQMLGANTPLGAPALPATSPGYQQATSALKTIAQSYLYSVSGAAATDAETQKIVDSVTPKFGESKESADNKKERIRRMVESIKAAGGGNVAGGDEAGGNTTSTGVTWSIE